MISKNSNEGNLSESGFKISSLVLLESNFSRVPAVTFDNSIKPKIQIDVGVSVKEDKTVIVKETVTYSSEHNGVLEVSCKISMAGTFQRIGDSKIENLREFGEVNGAAIIFPYIREHLSSLSAKAGLGLIILPPVNFTILRQEVHPKQ